MNKYIQNLNMYYLITLMPIFLITGPLLSDLCLIILSLFFLFKENKNFKKILFENFLIKFILFFFIYNIFISFFAEDIFASSKSAISHIRFVLFSITFIFLFNEYIKIRIVFFWILYVAIFITSFDAIVQFHLNKNLLGWEIDAGGRISGLFGTEYILGSYLGKMLPLLISMKLFLKENDKIFVNRYIFLLTIILCFLAIYYSGERTSILIITTYFVGYIIFVVKLPITKKILLLLGLILSVTVIITSSETLKKRVIDLTISNLSFFYKDNAKFLDTNKNQFIDPENIHQNIKHLIVAKQIFKEKPILGHGNKMFGKICFEKYFVDDGRCSIHPHNFLAQVLVENGIIGGIFYLMLFFYFFKNAFNLKKNSQSLTSISLICSIIFFPLLPSGNFYNNWLNINIFLLISFFIFCKQNQLIKNN